MFSRSRAAVHETARGGITPLVYVHGTWGVRFGACEGKKRSYEDNGSNYVGEKQRTRRKGLWDRRKVRVSAL